MLWFLFVVVVVVVVRRKKVAVRVVAGTSTTLPLQVENGGSID